jgi:hypothetical protein
MKNLSCFLIVFLFIIESSIAQCGNGSVITFTTQTSLNTFQATYPGCINFNGGIRLDGTGVLPDKITDLSPLTSLKNTTKELWVYNTEVSTLAGLGSLVSVNGGLLIQSNPNLVNIDSLHNLQSINSYFLLSNNINLERTDGLISLSSITGYLNVSYNTKLKACCGLFPLLSTPTNVTGTIDFMPGNTATCDDISDIINGGFISVNLDHCYTDLSEATNYAASNGGSIGTYLNISNNNPLTIPNNVSLNIYGGIFENKSTFINNGIISTLGGSFINSLPGIYKGTGNFNGNLQNNGIVAPGN